MFLLQKVEVALTAVLGPRYREVVGEVVSTGLDITREVLGVGAEVLELAPIPGLATAARVLVDIWDAVQLVDVSTVTLTRLPNQLI